jgi:hypothetical protein
MICFIALAIQRVIRATLKAKLIKGIVSLDCTISILRRIQTHLVLLNDSKLVSGISIINPEQLAILESLGVKKQAYTNR